MASKVSDSCGLSDSTPIYDAVLGRLPPRAAELPGRHPTVFLWVRMFVLLGIFVLVDYFFQGAGHLSIAAYEQPLLLLGVLERLGVVRLGALMVLTLTLMRYGSLLDPWESLELGQQQRWLVVFLAGIMAWTFSTYGYNYYYDQAHYFDRAMIVVLVPFIHFRPLFLYPFLLIVFCIMWQLGEPPLGSGSIFSHYLQVLHILTLFGATFLIHSVTGSRRADGFFFLKCCLVAGAYWEPAVAKLEINWINHGHLYRMLLAAYAHGWVSFLEPSALVSLAKAISWFDWPMRIFVMTIEAGYLVFLWRRSVSVALLATVMVLHLGVFALYGYFFWTWVLVDAALLIILVRDWQARRIEIYDRHRFLISVLFIGFASVWCNPSHLGWFDTRVTYTYRFEGFGVSGKQYSIPPRFFEPYGDVFTMSNFGYLPRDHGVLVGPYGISRVPVVAESLMEATTPNEIFALESEIAGRRHDPVRAERFYAFIARYIANRNKTGGRGGALQALHPPAQFWSFGRGEVYEGQEPIREVAVNEVTTLFDENSLVEIRSLELRRIPIPVE